MEYIKEKHTLVWDDYNEGKQYTDSLYIHSFWPLYLWKKDWRIRWTLVIMLSVALAVRWLGSFSLSLSSG